MQFFRQQNKVLNTVIFVVEIDMVYIIFRRDGYTIMFCVQLAIIHNQKKRPQFRGTVAAVTPTLLGFNLSVPTAIGIIFCKNTHYSGISKLFVVFSGFNNSLISPTLLSLATNDTTG